MYAHVWRVIFIICNIYITFYRFVIYITFILFFILFYIILLLWMIIDLFLFLW